MARGKAKVRYFAYGSNMNRERIRARIPSAREIGTATLDGWRVVERLYADIEPATGARTHGVLYEIPSGDLALLDRYEGFPRVYGSLEVRVKVRGGSVAATAYVMTDATRSARIGMAYPEHYRAICSAGARQHGIPDAFATRTETPRGALLAKGGEAVAPEAPSERAAASAPRGASGESGADGGVLVAVYGTLMEGERNAHWVEEANARRLGPCTMRGRLFDTGFGFPAFTPGGRKTVSGELVLTDRDGLAHMDVLEGYPRLYRRERIKAVCGKAAREAFVYVMNRLPDGATEIPGGSWKRRHTRI